MTARARFEKILAQAITDPDPVARLRTASRRRDLGADLRRALRAATAGTVGEDGVRLAALLVVRLRFERLLRGCPEAETWFNDDPAAFTEDFRRYHHAVPPTAFFPGAEARTYRAWRDGGG